MSRAFAATRAGSSTPGHRLRETEHGLRAERHGEERSGHAAQRGPGEHRVGTRVEGAPPVRRGCCTRDWQRGEREGTRRGSSLNSRLTAPRPRRPGAHLWTSPTAVDRARALERSRGSRPPPCPMVSDRAAGAGSRPSVRPQKPFTEGTHPAGRTGDRGHPAVVSGEHESLMVGTDNMTAPTSPGLLYRNRSRRFNLRTPHSFVCFTPLFTISPAFASARGLPTCSTA